MKKILTTPFLPSYKKASNFNIDLETIGRIQLMAVIQYGQDIYKELGNHIST